MPILLKTQIERTAKTPIPACHARVGSLCDFQDTVERVPAGSPKTGRCAAVRERCGKRQAQNEQQREKLLCGKRKQDARKGKTERFWTLRRKGRRKAWRFSAPARPLLPAVRAVSGDKNGAFLRLSKME